MVRLMTYSIVPDKQPSTQDIDILQQGINAYNATQLKEHPHEFAIYLRDGDGRIHGGITAFAFSDSIHIALLWVSDELRSQGYGSLLLEAAEDKAIKEKLQYAFVDTFDFQAADFYSKHGYELIGKIDQALLGHSRLFYRKKLS